jgi:hypothetical protein
MTEPPKVKLESNKLEIKLCSSIDTTGRKKQFHRKIQRTTEMLQESGLRTRVSCLSY